MLVVPIVAFLLIMLAGLVVAVMLGSVQAFGLGTVAMAIALSPLFAKSIAIAGTLLVPAMVTMVVWSEAYFWLVGPKQEG